MEYDDDRERAGRRKGSSRQPVKRPGGREPDYRRNREPGYQGKGRPEPELTLITDSFRDDSWHRQGQSSREAERHGAGKKAGSRKRQEHAGKNGSRSKAQRQSAASRMDGGNAYHNNARKKARRQRHKILIILAELCILLGVLAFIGFHYVANSMGMIQRLPWNPDEIKNVEISEEKQEQMKGYWTIAIFGVDSRNSSVGKGNNSDVNIICNINMDTGELKMVSVFRDTYLNINDKNSYNKINAAYLQGGPELAVKALNKNLDLDIDDYATFNWKAVADAINILGGVDVELSKAEYFYINAFITETVKATGVPSEQLTHAGLNHLDGVQAVAYGRLRLMDTDYARTERQRKIISLAFEKVKKADWKTLSYIIQTVFPQVATSIEVDDIMSEIGSLGKFHMGETIGFPMARGETGMGSKGACVIPQTLESNVVELHQFLFGDEEYTPTETVRAISKKIASDTGLAKAGKSIDHVGTNGGSVPKSAAGTKEETKDKESVKEESSGTHESTERESGESGAHRETGYYDEFGVYWESGAYPGSSGQETHGTRPSGTSGVPGTTGAANIQKPGETEKESMSSGIPKPGTGQTSSSTSAYENGTGVIIGPVNGGNNTGNGQNAPGSGTGSSSSGSGNGQNAPGSGTSGSGNGSGGGQNAPGSGGTGNPSGAGGAGSQYPGAAGTTSAYGQPGSGNVEFSGPNGQ